MNLSELREKHPRFVYESYNFNQQDKNLRVRFQFTLEPNIIFTPEVVIPIERQQDLDKLENFVFHLGLIETISYWKAACSPELRIDAGNLTDQQISWWHDLFIHGLGEFFYQNDIDFTKPGFLNIIANPARAIMPTYDSPSAKGDLVLLGGGKDSSVTLELLKEAGHPHKVMVLNPIQSSLDVARTAEEELLVVQRTIDAKLLELNNAGYLNGHTPFSAYLAFLGTFVGILHDYRNIIVSNERSSGESNLVFHDLPVNHQYSKSARFENLFREYCKKYISGTIQYFSFLRPLYDLQISQLFAQYPKYHESFRSCNVGQKENIWCGQCPKCAFVYISLFPFIPYDKMLAIFGKDYYMEKALESFIRELVGLGAHKPFDCVGTEEETKLAVGLAIQKYRADHRIIPPLLVNLEQKLNIGSETTIRTLEEHVMNKWSEDNFLPPEYTQILKNALGKTQ